MVSNGAGDVNQEKRDGEDESYVIPIHTPRFNSTRASSSKPHGLDVLINGVINL